MEGNNTESDDDSSCTYVSNFENMNLNKNILRGIFSYGYENPSPIQIKAIPLFLKGTDIIAQAQSGTGKTAAFSISVLQQIDENIKTLQAVIISPTRELSEQIYNVIKQLAHYTKIQFALLVGGNSRKHQINILKQGVHIIIATPGRLNDFLSNQYIDVDNIKYLILDEADELINNNFVMQIRNILEYIPETTQIGLFSATLSKECLDITKNFLHSPKIISVKKEQLTLDGIKQYFITTYNDKWKYDAISDLYSSMIINQLIIYCNTKQRVIYLTNTLQMDGHSCSCIHSDLSTEDRLYTLQQFRKGNSRVLISTDLLARGIDIQQVSLVVNYDVPTKRENYIHRIGRSGRYGRKGIALNFITEADVNLIRNIEKYYETEINEFPENVNDIFNNYQ
tara:strand:+ start:901 stop:2088 length:1188 start_codon:yes stop_codon:yes gene_type:complete